MKVTNFPAVFWFGFFVPVAKAFCTFQPPLVTSENISIYQEISILYLDWLLSSNSICLYPMLNSLVHSCNVFFFFLASLFWWSTSYNNVVQLKKVCHDKLWWKQLWTLLISHHCLYYFIFLNYTIEILCAK